MRGNAAKRTPAGQRSAFKYAIYIPFACKNMQVLGWYSQIHARYVSTAAMGAFAQSVLGTRTNFFFFYFYIYVMMSEMREMREMCEEMCG